MLRKLAFAIAALGLAAGLGAYCYDAGMRSAGAAASAEAERLRADRDRLQKRHDAAVEGLSQAERQLRLSQQAYAELSAALNVSREQMARMREELETIRRALESRPGTGSAGQSRRAPIAE
jgi:chromosome segregation ATPase